jgi:hypothetical protein
MTAASATAEGFWTAGVYDGMPDDVYYGDPVPDGSLSSSGARLLLPPSCPAKFDWERKHGRAPKRAWDIGHAAHERVLGVGPALVVVQTTAKDGAKSAAENYLTKSAQQHRDEIRAAGAVPVLRSELDAVEDMAKAIREHPIARVLFDPDLGGRPEQSLFWLDPQFDVWRRTRLDWLPAQREDGRLIVPDYKSCTSAEPASVERSVASYGYDVQDVFYRDGLRALGLAEEPAFIFVFQEKDPPYLITVVELDGAWRRIGRRRVDEALGVFAECQGTDQWPGYTSDVELVGPPAWVARQYEAVVL